MAPSSAAWKPGAGKAGVEVGEPGGGGRVRIKQHVILRPAVQLGEVQRGKRGAGLEQRLEIHAAGEIDVAKLTPPAGCECEAGMRGGVAAVDGEVGHGGEVDGEARRNKAFRSAISFGWSGRLLEEEAGAPAIHEAKENSGWPYNETSERLSRSSTGKQKVGESSRKPGALGSPRSAITTRVARSAASSLRHAIEALCRDQVSPRKPRMIHTN
ncbi:hypothetical protein CFC21_022443 [Triticum aestivum]|uniref:Uncharacterized protein n=2 Tax=Triticum aestivum TaxID=4565 RepID=A0A9R1EBW0_WHEAT|nr:uncharacterized protein LOC123043452 [Triticum aestivum]XP_044321838.1 uncharacterized protein LOC123043452 [Triticum aestivum]KAF7007513.1 hypothetical protein CFC21_022443 [Triticum aestivum]